MTKKPSPRVIVLPIVSVLLIFLLNTCGIEQFIQLNPPSNPVQLGEKVTFRKTTNNNEQYFTGFELYYKFYAAGENPYADLNDIIEFEDLGSKRFRRIHSPEVGSDQPPLVYIQPNDRSPTVPAENDAFTLSVYLSGAPDTLELTEPIEYPIIVDDGTTELNDGGESLLPGPEPILIEIQNIRRDVYDDSDDSYKEFSDFSSGDADISYNPELWSDIDAGNPITIVLYVVSYGYDLSNYRPLYSEPVRLGIIDRTFPLP